MISVSSKTFVYPTDTVWGIGGSIYSKDSYELIASIKGTSTDKPLSILFSSIEQLRTFFNFPSSFTDRWLQQFFALESTLAIPLLWQRKEIPSWITAGSPLVAVRCLSLDGLSKIVDEVGSPITTTSFNATGTPSIQDRDEAYKLFNNWTDTLVFVDDESAPLSGNSSTICAVSEQGIDKFLRKGSRASEVESICGLLST